MVFPAFAIETLKRFSTLVSARSNGLKPGVNQAELEAPYRSLSDFSIFIRAKLYLQQAR